MKWLIIGLCILLLGFGWDVLFVNLPYQDPTPAMQEQWNMDKTIASALYWAGLAVLLAAFLKTLLLRKTNKRE